MFFQINKIKKNIEQLYQSLTKAGGIPKGWLFWDQKRERLQELSEEDENLIQDILDLYEHARLLKNNKLIKEIEERALQLKQHLEKIKEEFAESPDLSLQAHQEEILEKIIYKLQDTFAKFIKAQQTKIKTRERNLQRFLSEKSVKQGHKQYFVFYRAEHLADQPLLNEDSSGQFGKGVYFTASIAVAKRFRSKASRIFVFYIEPKIFLEKLKPLFISKENIKPFEEYDPAVFQEYLDQQGYGETSFCVIGPIPEFNYVIQIMIEKEMLDHLLEEGFLHWKLGEEFN